MIYFVQSGQRGPIKIGYVENETFMERRLAMLQTGNAERLYLVAQLPGDLQRERELHHRFAEGRLVGEWFRWDTAGLQELIYEAVEQEGELVTDPRVRRCSWCIEGLVRPPRTKLCSDECERAKKLDTARRWKAARQ